MDRENKPSCFEWGEMKILRSLRFAGKLNVFRSLKHLTISEMSEKSGVPAKTLERLLTGENAPNAYTLKRIERAFDLNFDPEDFLENE